MHVHKVLAALALSAYLPSWAAATLHGMVSKCRERGEPVSGVQVSAMGGGSDLTGNDGQFKLFFQDRQPADDVDVRVKREGWDVVNRARLNEGRLPASPKARPFEVIMSPLAEREGCAREHYQMLAEREIDRNYKAKLAKLEERLAETETQRDALARERDRSMSLTRDWARQAVRLEADESKVSPAYRNALGLFSSGRPDAALMVLNKSTSDVQASLLKGALLSSRFDREGAARAYDEAVKADPGSFDAWYGKGLFNRRTGQTSAAATDMERALTLAPDPASTAAVLNNLGYLNSFGKKDLGLARKQYLEALSIRTSLAEKEPDIRADVAQTFSDLGELDRMEGRNDAARQNFENALRLRSELSKERPAIHKPGMAQSLTSLGSVNTADRRFGDARGQFQAALDIRSELAMKEPERYRPLVANNHSQLGTVSLWQGKTPEARWHYNQALDLRTQLAQQYPQTYLPQVAASYSELARLSTSDRKPDDARMFNTRALEIYRGLAKTKPDAYAPQVAATLYSIGIQARSDKQIDEASDRFNEALYTLRPYADRSASNAQLVRQLEAAIGALRK